MPALLRRYHIVCLFAFFGVLVLSLLVLHVCRIPEIAAKAKALKVTAGHLPGCDVGPMISPQVHLLCVVCRGSLDR